MSNIQLIEEGRRVYVAGNSFPIKDAIKEAGGHWDKNRKQWWIGANKKTVIEKAISGTSETKSEQPEGPYDGGVRGKAEYKGKSYYIRWEGTTPKGETFRLVTLDGKLSFWADASLVTVTKRYQAREPYGFRGRPAGRAEYPTLSGIRKFIEEKKSEKPEDRQNAPTKQCWECGCAFTFADARANGGDWSDSYCGC